MKIKQIISILLSTTISFSAIALPTSANAKTVVKTPTLYSVKQTDITTAKITWSKVGKAKGYTLYYSTNGKKYKKLTTTKKKYYVHKKLKDNQKYFYKVKSYRKSKGKKVYSKFSNIQILKCKNDLLALYEPYSISGPCWTYRGDNEFSMSGNKYRYGLQLGGSSWTGITYADFNLNGKYKYMQFTFGDISFIEKSTLQIRADDNTVAEYTINPGDIIKTVNVDIENAVKLEFWIKSDNGCMGIANIKLYK